MAYLVCDHEASTRVGIRIRAPCRANAHPAYANTQEYHCSVCGGKLRHTDIHEYNQLIEAGAGSGA